MLHKRWIPFNSGDSSDFINYAHTSCYLSEETREQLLTRTFPELQTLRANIAAHCYFSANFVRRVLSALSVLTVL